MGETFFAQVVRRALGTDDVEIGESAACIPVAGERDALVCGGQKNGIDFLYLFQRAQRWNR